MAQSVAPKLTRSRSTPAESASILSLAKKFLAEEDWEKESAEHLYPAISPSPGAKPQT